VSAVDRDDTETVADLHNDVKIEADAITRMHESDSDSASTQAGDTSEGQTSSPM